jgi:GNAT superfamily N-acetyltransferase
MRSATGDLDLAVTADADSPILEQFFSGYDKAFILPNEKEGLAGFRQCLELNSGPKQAELARRYGPFREVVFVARDASIGDLVVGGGNLLAFPLPAQDDAAAVDCLCANLNYIYVVPAARGRGYLRALIRAVDEMAVHIFVTLGAPWSGILGRLAGSAPEALPRIVFFEQKDPVRMTGDDYVRDCEHAGVDQFDRLQMWARRGARIVDFPYVQPPLSQDQAADDTLLYTVPGAAATAHVAPALLKRHLERFFSISVLKSTDAGSQSCAAGQLNALASLERAGCGVPLLDPLPWLDARRHRSEKGPAELHHAASYRDLIRSWSHSDR